jgi:hypothetical protein
MLPAGRHAVGFFPACLMRIPSRRSTGGASVEIFSRSTRVAQSSSFNADTDFGPPVGQGRGHGLAKRQAPLLFKESPGWGAQP